MARSWKGFAGPVVQISREDGDTSGRFGVAKTIARLFPARKAFVEGAIAEGIKSATSFPYGPYPADTLKYRNENIVEFLTPAQKDGLGTASRLQKSDTPISGVAILVGEEPNLLSLWLRLPSEMSDFAQLIIHCNGLASARRRLDWTELAVRSAPHQWDKGNSMLRSSRLALSPHRPMPDHQQHDGADSAELSNVHEPRVRLLSARTAGRLA